MISFSPNCLWANGKDILVNKPYREQRERKSGRGQNLMQAVAWGEVSRDLRQGC